MPFRKRRQFFVDPEFQGALLKRYVTHWLLCVVTGVLLLLCWHMVSNPGEPSHVYFEELWTTYWRALIVALAMLLVASIDFVRLSNRVCGPLMRLKSGMRQLSLGRRVPMMRFREGDFWTDFATAFNTVAQRLEAYEASRTGGQYVPPQPVEEPEPVAVSASED